MRGSLIRLATGVALGYLVAVALIYALHLGTEEGLIVSFLCGGAGVLTMQFLGVGE